MKIKYSFLIVLLFFQQILSAQVTQEWVRNYNGSSNYTDQVLSLSVGDSGNVYVTGFSYGVSSRDFLTVKYNPAGILNWATRYDNADDYSYGIITDKSGNVYITGESSQEFITIKYNSFSTQVWLQRINLGILSGKNFISQDNSGNIIVAGSVSKQNNSCFVLLKYNSDGNLLWSTQYDSLGRNYQAFGMAVDNFNNIYITGSSIGLSNAYGFTTVKFNSNGIQQWEAHYNGGIAYGIVLDNSGNIIVTGEISSNFATVKYDSEGVQQWVSSYTGNPYSSPTSIAADISGNIFVTGWRGLNNYDSSPDYVTIKYNSLGVQQWVAVYNGPGSGSDIPYKILCDKYGNSYVTGNSAGITTNKDAATIKYNSSGVQQWIARYNSPVNDNDNIGSMALDSSGNVYIAGCSPFAATGYDFIVIKYSQSVGINNISNNVPDKFLLYQNYPNPFNPTTKIKFDIPKLSDVKIIIFDAAGREVKNITQNNLTAGSYEYEFNGENLSSGIYYFKLQTNEFSKSVKMVLVK